MKITKITGFGFGDVHTMHLYHLFTFLVYAFVSYKCVSKRALTLLRHNTVSDFCHHGTRLYQPPVDGDGPIRVGAKFWSAELLHLSRASKLPISGRTLQHHTGKLAKEC